MICLNLKDSQILDSQKFHFFYTTYALWGGGGGEAVAQSPLVGEGAQPPALVGALLGGGRRWEKHGRGRTVGLAFPTRQPLIYIVD